MGAFIDIRTRGAFIDVRTMGAPIDATHDPNFDRMIIDVDDCPTGEV